MKKIYIVALIMMVAAAFMLIKSPPEVTTYSDFSVAVASQKEVKIAGQLAKDKEMYYEPAKDPNYFTFFIRDNKGEERKVVLLAAKPKDFEMSEQIVVTGKMNGEDFVASDVLLKCPSKYKDEEVYIKAEKSS
ncbi:MAG: cytochrome c maturation protein CcmE [Saprospiraceae bacterium]|nr:cytochrome c maturation protein CcmE [Saprospiraceae bacterium]